MHLEGFDLGDGRDLTTLMPVLIDKVHLGWPELRPGNQTKRGLSPYWGWVIMWPERFAVIVRISTVHFPLDRLYDFRLLDVGRKDQQQLLALSLAISLHA